MWRFGCECKSSKCIHNQVNPKHLHRSKRRVLENTSAREDNKQRNQVNCDLELEEFTHTVVNVSSVFDCGED